MKDETAQPLTLRLHALVSRLSRDGGYIVAQADVAEAATRIIMLEQALGELLDHIDLVAYLDTAGSRLSDAMPAVSAARAVLGNWASSR